MIFYPLCPMGNENKDEMRHLTVEKKMKNEPFFRFLPTVMMLVFVEEDGVSVSLVFFRSRSS